MNCGSKIVVFDLDETLGYFVEFGMFWDTLKNYYKSLNLNKIPFAALTGSILAKVGSF